MSQLSIFGHVLAFADVQSSNNPQLRFLDWSTSYANIPIKNPQSKAYILDPAETRTIFSGARTLLVDGTTAFDLALSALNPSVYRMSLHAGTAPGFRTDRALTLSGQQVTVTVNNNVTVLFGLAASSGQNFSAVQVGDSVLIPGVTTGDPASPFNQSNEGLWTVMAVVTVASVANHGLVCQRPAGQAFQGVSEVVAGAAITVDTQFQAFSAGPVQVGDMLQLSAGFSTITQQSFQISAVAPTYVEFLSSQPLPLETDITPGASGIAIYNNSQNYVRIETDQLAYVKINAGSNIPLKTRSVGGANGVGFLELWGDIWQLQVVNRNPGSQMNVFVASAIEDNG